MGFSANLNIIAAKTQDSILKDEFRYTPAVEIFL
jgi:hypothetical protein